MQKWIVIDTEGSALFDFKRPADAEGQPRLAEIAILYLDENLQIEREYQRLIRPDGWVLHPDAAAVNGLTMERLMAEGVPVGEVLDRYAEAIDAGYAVVAWNAQHDCKAMRAEFRRAGRPDRFEQTANFCAMRKSNGVVLKPGGKKGWPKLSEACEFIGRARDESGVHRALGDARDCHAVFLYLRDRGVDLTPEVHYAREKPGAIEVGAPVTMPPRALRSAAPIDEVAKQEIPE